MDNQVTKLLMIKPHLSYRVILPKINVTQRKSFCNQHFVNWCICYIFMVNMGVVIMQFYLFYGSKVILLSEEHRWEISTSKYSSNINLAHILWHSPVETIHIKMYKLTYSIKKFANSLRCVNDNRFSNTFYDHRYVISKEHSLFAYAVTSINL
jgi:hypothetical protein